MAADSLKSLVDYSEDKDLNNWHVTVHKHGEDYQVKVLLQSLRLILTFPTLVKIVDVDKKRQILEKEQAKEKT